MVPFIAAEPCPPAARQRLPWRRRCVTRSLYLDGHKLHITVGFYPDGRPGEVFVNLHKVGAFSRGMVESFARLVSNELQRGLTAKEFVEKFGDIHFGPPCGEVRGHETITEAPSVAALVALVVAGEVEECS